VQKIALSTYIWLAA